MRRYKRRWFTKKHRRNRHKRDRPLYPLPHGVAWHAIMVQWDSRERGVRLGDSEGLHGIYLGCTPCNRWVGVAIEEAIEQFGAETYMRDLAQRLRCKECGERKGYVQVWARS